MERRPAPFSNGRCIPQFWKPLPPVDRDQRPHDRGHPARDGELPLTGFRCASVGRSGNPAIRGGAAKHAIDAVSQNAKRGNALYFHAPKGTHLGNTVGKLGWQIDRRGVGGYVVAPGSVRSDGYYTIIDTAAVAPLPA
ncbi:MAG: bifunctional DNA primase/polymerase [Pseudonocardia sp.]|nr:bifunctional DNA primase/polymerase [Pseudonocardia sp.]